MSIASIERTASALTTTPQTAPQIAKTARVNPCGIYPLYTSDAADDLPRIDYGGRRSIKKKQNNHQPNTTSQ